MMELALSHYRSRKRFSKHQLEHDEQGGEPAAKPRGFWVSADGPDDWREWCLREQFRTENLRRRYRVKLQPDANVLLLDTEAKMIAFHDEFSSNLFHDSLVADGFNYPLIEWRRVAEKYDGIIIAPYFWRFRLETPLSHWYYGWDCASGCIWEPRAIASITSARR